MFISGLLALSFFSSRSAEFRPLQTVPWHQASIFQINTDKDTEVEKIVSQYLKNIARKGFATSQQGVYIQSDWVTLANNRGEVPAPAASLTKVATTIASLQTWDLDHRFLTKFYHTGQIIEGSLQGDLIIDTQGDPLFVWEEGISVGHHLQRLGVKKITGNLIIVGKWEMNYKTNILESGTLFKEVLNSQKWSPIIEKQYQTIRPTIPRPEIILEGSVKTAIAKPDNPQLLMTHKSLTLKEILRLMNVYSNNYIAESLAHKIGGGKRVAQIAAKFANVPEEEVLLINGSGLGVNNRISPRAACGMFMALDKSLENSDINIGDLFPVAGVDITGTIEDRNIPDGIAGKTGTLAVVSALSGVIPTIEREKVCFAIINYGNGIPTMRRNQDILLKNLQEHWQLQPLTPNKSIVSNFGDRQRNF